VRTVNWFPVAVIVGGIIAAFLYFIRFLFFDL
jgi:hypothetical protein